MQTWRKSLIARKYQFCLEQMHKFFSKNVRSYDSVIWKEMHEGLRYNQKKLNFWKLWTALEQNLRSISKTKVV